MRKTSTPRLAIALAAMLLAAFSRSALAGDLGWLNVTNWFKGTKVDVHRPEASKQCGHEGCIERVPCEECVTGEKKEWKTTIHHEYVAIPEVRYRWEMKWITKEIPCESGCIPVCKDRPVEHEYESEHWEKYQSGCCELHCKTCEPKTEKLDCKECESKPGKTTVKVHYWSCVKVPYTVYRQVEKEVCVKQPRYEKVEVPITRYVCEHCGGLGCKHCCRDGEAAVAEDAPAPQVTAPGAAPANLPEVPIPAAPKPSHGGQ